MVYSEQRRRLANAKGILADLIVDEVSGREGEFKFQRVDHYFRDNGFVYSMAMNEQEYRINLSLNNR